MKKTFVILKREYLSRVKTRGFIIATLLMPVLIVFMTTFPAFFAKLNVEKPKRIAVVDLTGRIFVPFSAALMDARRNEKGEPLYKPRQISIDQRNLEQTKSEIIPLIQNGTFDALVIIPRDVFESNFFELYAKNVGNYAFNTTIERFLSNVITDIRLNESGLDTELIKELSGYSRAMTFNVGDKGETKRESGSARFGVIYFMVFTLYMALIMYGVFVMRGIIQDKTSRVMEVVVSSVRPFQLMTGKVLGIGAMGLTQLAIWAVFSGMASAYGLALVKMFNPSLEDLVMPSITISLLLSFIIYFLMGYFLYATLFAGLASIVNSEDEAQQLQWGIIALLVLSFMLMIVVIRGPDGTAATVLSLFPFFSPILMFARIAMNAAPAWQIIVSMILTMATIVGLMWIVSRIFRVGILMYGKRPTMRELMKWIKFT